jgi:hypothetical protein
MSVLGIFEARDRCPRTLPVRGDPPCPRSNVGDVAPNTAPSDVDYHAAARPGLLGLMPGQELDSVVEKLAALHPRYNTFPAEVLLELAAEAIEESGASPADPVLYEGMRDRLLPEFVFRGKLPQHKSHYALMAAAMTRAGVYPDLLDEAAGWGLEDMWEYAFYALLLYGRAAAERIRQSPEAIAAAIAFRRGIDLESAQGP